MEDDDEFGDLYTDVLRPFTEPSRSQTQEVKAPATSAAAGPKTTSLQDRREIDLNNIDSDDEEILFGASDSNSNIKNDNNTVHSSMQQKTLALEPDLEKRPGPKGTGSDRVSSSEVEKSIDRFVGGGEKGGEFDFEARVLDKIEDGISKERALGELSLVDEGDIDVMVEERDDKDDDLVEKDENFVDKNENIENLVGANENLTNLGDEEGVPMIPGVSSIPGISGGVGDVGDANFDEEDDSDSEDDLQIVLNNDDELGLMGIDRMGGIGGEEDDDEDGDPLVIVADNDNMGHQPMMDIQEWGEEAGAGADGERKELGDAAKVNGGVAVPPKVPYGNHTYNHPFHSQFKYVRPGAAPMPGAASAGPGGTPGQVRPPVNVGLFGGRGRGDWRPAGIKGGPLMQKGFHGMPVWGSNASGRGLEFTLPSHKTIFEVDIDSFEEKPWKLPGIDISDFFNFGLNEESWKNYCKQLEQQRLEATMQSRIRVYESGRTEQEYDPDLPPELAAASGVQDISSENANLVRTDAGQNDLSRGSARLRPPLPTGRPIQVETNYTDRLPSIDTRQPRIRDSDAIIEIVCQDSADEGSPENDMVEQQDGEISREALRGADEIDDLSQENGEQFDDLSHAHNSRKKEFVGRRGHSVNPIHDKMTDGDESLPLSSESSMHRHPNSREQTPIYSGRNSGAAHVERRIKGRTRDRSPRKATTESTRDKRLIENEKEEESYESVDGKHSPLSSSAIAVDAAGDQDLGKNVSIPDESVAAERSSEKDREGMELDITTQDEMLEDEKLIYSSENQKSSSRVDQPSLEIDDGEDSKAARSSENSKARSASSTDYKKSRDGVEEEVVQGGHSAHMGNNKRSIGRDETVIRRKGYDGRQETERHRTSAKVMEESYPCKGWEPNSTNSLRVKTDSTDRRREGNTERALQRSVEDLHGRRARVEDTRKRAHADEIGSRHRNKVRESERSQKDEHHQLREHLDDGSRRGNHDKDMGSKYRERDDSLKRRYENVDYLQNKRRKEDAFFRREQAEKEEILHGHREISSSRKKERDDVSDLWKRDDQARLRDDDVYNVRHKEEALFQRERGERQRDHDEWHRSKHSREEILSKRDREEGRSGLKSIRAAEEKVWSSHSRGKEEYKGYDREYHSKDAGRQSEQPKRRDRLENEILTQQKGREDVYGRINQHSSDARRARHERESTRDDRAANDSDNHKVQEKKHKEYPRKGKEPEAGDRSSLALSRRNQDEHSGQTSETASLKGKIEQRSGENEVHKNHKLSRKHNEEVLSDDEHSLSRRGRSKLERWTSHKERDFGMSTTKSSSSLQIKEVEEHNSIEPSLSSKLSDEPLKPVEDRQRPAAKDKDAPEINNIDMKLVDNKHLDTVEKLKKRSERFKLPLPSEKEVTATKKIENEPPSAQNEIHPDTEIKPERPARKRRWTSN